MNKKIQKLIEPGTRMFLLFLVLFAGVTFFFDVRLAAAEAAVITLLVIYSVISSRRNSRQILEYIESVTYDAAEAKDYTLMNFPLPIVVFRMDGYRVIWGNQMFFDICGGKTPSFETTLIDLIPNFSAKWMFEGKNQTPAPIDIDGRKFQVHGNVIRSAGDADEEGLMGITYWLDVTDYETMKSEYESSRPVVCIIVLDNYDEILKGTSDLARNDLRGKMESCISGWCGARSGIFRRIDRDRFIFIFEERHLSGIIEEKFTLLDDIRKIVNPRGIHATMSIGIGYGGADMEENQSFAGLGIEMALSRGGDQVVLKNRFTFDFFGGRGAEVETRTRVKTRVMANALSELIGDSSKIFVMGHKFADLDSLGAAAGVCCVARFRDKPYYIVMDKERHNCALMLQALMDTPEYKGAVISPEEAMVIADGSSLLVVVDTNRPEQVEDENLLMAMNRVAVIDHHRRAATYIQNAVFSLHEPYASSVCELMAELLQEIVGQSGILKIEAEAMLAGLVMDTKSFTIRTGERTFDAAAFLRRAGGDTTEVKKLLQIDLHDLVARYKILQSARIYRDGIAIAAPVEPQDRVTAAQAADELLGISGVSASIVAYPAEDGGVYVSARSIGDINVQVILEKFGGGGNASSAGAQIKNTGLTETVDALLAAIDEYLDE